MSVFSGPKTEDRRLKTQAKRFQYERSLVFSLLSLVLISSLTITFTGCASLGTYNPATGRKEFIFISTQEEISLGQSIHRKILQQEELSENLEKLERVKRIGQRLAAVSDRRDYSYKFYLIEKDEMNAFTTPGGNIYFYTGLMDKLATDDEIAAVLAHEIGHCAARHTVKKFQAALGYNLITSLILNQLSEGQAQNIASLSSDVIMNIVFSAYSRQDEHEADRLGVKYTHLACYDAQAMIKTFQVLEKESRGPDVPLILRSHPYISDRLRAVNNELSSVSSRYPRIEPCQAAGAP